MLSERRHHRLLLIVVVVIVVVAPLPNTGQASEGCQEVCGNLTIPYPFGTKEGCYHDDMFLITCNTTFSPHKAFLRKGNIEVTNISLDAGELTVLSRLASDCYYENGTQSDRNTHRISFSAFKVSSRKNKFTLVGCDAVAFLTGSQGSYHYTSGCVAFCDTIDNMSNGSCTGVGCCQTSLPTGLNSFDISVNSVYNHTQVWNISSCGYGFIAEENAYNFSVPDLHDLGNIIRLPVVLDWAVGNETCEDIRKDNRENICSFNSNCSDSYNGHGYLCKCNDGYEGNPYGLIGCQDIDECRDESLNQCEKRCNNMLGNYTCLCPKGYHGDGRKDGQACIQNIDQLLAVKIVTGTISSLMILLVSFSWTYLLRKKRKLVQLKEKFFRQNGGVMLQQQLSNQREKSSETMKIYSAEELRKASDSYSESRIIGRGGYGTVYKGILSNFTIVAIKKSKVVDATQIEQFVNEVIVLSQINHRNVVKLMGCCMETEVPLLVYEFIPNGTLYDHIHNRDINSSLTWNYALRIVREVAGVLSYLHSAASVPIIHRDIKSTNILLDENFTAKVSDFGASRLVPLDEMELSTMVQGTLGYLDPEYLHTSQLTEKSDVYSFGAVLVEILTKRKVLCFQKPEKERNLAMYFVLSLQEGRLFQILDERISREAGVESMTLIAKLAKRCLSLKGEDRPTMKEVSMELEGLKARTTHPWVSDDYETQSLIDVPLETFGIDSSRDVTIEYDSITENMALPVDHGGR